MPTDAFIFAAVSGYLTKHFSSVFETMVFFEYISKNYNTKWNIHICTRSFCLLKSLAMHLPRSKSSP